jgi:hypothetical protein
MKGQEVGGVGGGAGSPAAAVNGGGLAGFMEASGFYDFQVAEDWVLGEGTMVGGCRGMTGGGSRPDGG